MRFCVIAASAIVALLLSCGSTHAHKADKHSANITSTTTTVYNSAKALSLGQNRLIIKAIGENKRSYGGPEIETRLTLTKGAKTLTYQTYWVWTSKDYSGFYAANVSFNETGEWLAELSDTTGSAVATALWINTRSVVPSIGEAAIASDSKTLNANTKLRDLTTDDNPDPNFYRQSISEAIKSGKPSVIAFATPDLCRTAVCGPVMRELKGLAKKHAEVNFIHIEIYEPIESTNMELVPVRAVAEWQLPSEPWTFIVDANGNVGARYEGFVTAAEVHDALLQIDQR